MHFSQPREVFLRSDVKMKHTIVIVSAFFAAILAGLLVRFFGPVQVPIKETFAQRDVGVPVDFSQPAAPHSGQSELLMEAKPVPQKPYESADDTQLFFLANSKVGGECCPSVYSTDRGCLCVSAADAQIMESRGGNRAMGS